MLAFAFGGDWLLTTVYGSDFAGYGLLLTLLTLNTLIVSFAFVAGNGMAALAKPKGLFAGEVAYGICTLVMTVALVPRFQLMGAAAALGLGSLCASLISLVVLRRLMKDRTFEDALPVQT